MRIAATLVCFTASAGVESSNREEAVQVEFLR
jgi:hypothetical protein